ncbi:MAG: hypothetical protein ACOYCD_06700 [Kiritimatiellia bacterium]|jgi:hypothetical protein
MLNQSNNRRSGIALVMVLGVLSLMVLMAVSFAISMRTERVAAGNQLDTVRARQLAQVGLVRAMDFLYEECGSSLTNYNQIYPNWDVEVSYTSQAASVVAVDFLKGSASNFVPRALWDAAATISDTNASDNHAGKYWIHVTSETPDSANPDHIVTNLIGRVAFMILNCSGLLDANFVGGADRGIGTNPVEIALENLPDVASSSFVTERYRNVRYETQAELNELVGTNFIATNLFIYSRAPAGYYTNNGTTLVGTQINLAGELNDIKGRGEQIIGAFENAGFDSGQAGLLFTNLLLYLDLEAANIGPKSQFKNDPNGEVIALSNAFVARVPMVNELVLETTVTCTDEDKPVPGENTYKSETQIWVELWYPFFAPNNASVTVRLPLGAAPYNGIGAPSAEEMPATVPERDFAVTKHTVASATFTGVAGAQHTLGVSNLSVEVLAGAHIVDKVFPYRDLSMTITLPANQHGKTSAGVVLECVDPRFNWDPNDLNKWVVQGNNSTGKINLATTTFLGANQDYDKSWEMYVASASPLQSVGELGYLAYDIWRTLKLYGPGAHPVLDYFAIETNCGDFVTNVIWRGRVNPNTTNRAVLTALFDNMPIDEYPGQTNPAPQRLGLQHAEYVADFIIRNRSYTNLSDICRLNWENEGFPDPSFAENELRREAFLRNTTGLLSTRGQVYTVLIEAHLASGGNIPRNPSRQRAVAVIWRDAWTGEMIVRYLKWLQD